MLFLDRLRRGECSRSADQNRRLILEQLESRVLLAAGVLTRSNGDIAMPREVDVVPLVLSTNELTLPKGRTVLGITMHAIGSDNDLDPGRISVTPEEETKRVDPQIAKRDFSGQDNTSFTLARLASGSYELRVSGEWITQGAYVIEVFLAGDINDDFHVTRSDLDQIKSLSGARRGQPSYLDDADVNRNGLINRADVRLASRNLGVSSTMRPQNLPPILEPIAALTVMPGGRVEVPLKAIDPEGAPVTFSLVPAKQLPTGMLDGTGTLVFTPLPGELGTHHFTVTASDGFAASSQRVSLHVVADPVTSTRVSGVVKQTNGQALAGVRIEVGAVHSLTAADGSFQLDLGQGTPVSDTLRIRAELLGGPMVYPFIAEKLPLLLGHEVLPGLDNVIGRPIFLPPLDTANAVTIDPTRDTTVTTAAIPGASVLVAAGSLLDQRGALFTGKLSVTEVPPDLTPAALPANMLPDLVVTIQPGEMVFAAPALLSLPNRANYAPGTLLDLWSINPVTGEFDLVGKGRVGGDGSVIETVSGGIRNSSWHYFVPELGDLESESEEEGFGDCQPWCSDVKLNSSTVLESHALVSYQSLGAARGLTLVYDSLRADPRPIIRFHAEYAPEMVSTGNSQPPLVRFTAKLSVSQGGFSYQVPGFAGGQLGLSGGEHFWRVIPDGTVAQQGGEVNGAMQIDMRSFPSGTYAYSFNAGFARMSAGENFTGSFKASTGSVTVVNEINSPFGSGWGLAGLQKLVENPDGSVLLMDGDGSELAFDPPAAAGDAYVSRPWDFSTLRRTSDGQFERTMKDQTVYTFNSNNQLERVRDRNGLETRFLYDAANQLTTVVDPANLKTTLTYLGGKVASITDPMGRQTMLDYDQDGNLRSVTDPDLSKRTWGYDNGRRLTSEVDQRGHEELSFYDFAGRAEHAVLKDGATLHVSPAVSRELFDPSLTSDVFSAPMAAGKFSREAVYTDGNGNVETFVLDRLGQRVSSMDKLGPRPQVTRDDRNLIRTLIDGRNNLTRFGYDAAGNLTSIEDTVTRNRAPNAAPLFPGPLFAAGQATGPAVLTDLDGDGNLDAVTVNEPDARVAVLLGNGAGSFVRRGDFGVGDVPASVAVGDLNTDGIPDVVVANRSSESITVWLGVGDGLLRDRTDIVLSSAPTFVALADLNSDRHLDIVTANAAINTVTVLLGIGDGSFGSGADFQVGPKPVTVALGDLNGDRIIDLVTANNDNKSITVLMGNGDGTFAGRIDRVIGTRYALGLADLDGDQDLDIVGGDGGGIVVVLGTGDGSFGNPSRITSSPGASLALGDLDGDRDIDILTAIQNLGISLFVGNGDGTFATQTNLGGDFDGDFLTLGDLDGDADLDLVVGRANEIAVLIGKGDGSLAARADESFEIIGGPRSVLLDDFNGDGDLDRVMRRGLVTWIELGKGDGTFADARFAGSVLVDFMAAGDLDRDGRRDLVTVNGGSGIVSIFLGNGDGSFQDAVNVPVDAGIAAVAVGDVNADGEPDVVTVNSTASAVSILTGNGDGTLGLRLDLPAGAGARAVALGDLNLDGDLGIVTANAEADSVSIFEWGSAGNFSRQDIAVGDRPISVALGRVNRGTFPDIVTANEAGNSLSILLKGGGLSNSSFTRVPDLPLPSAPASVLLDDLNGDCARDLVVATQRTISVLAGAGDGSFGARADFSGAPVSSPNLALGDLNNDGHPDYAAISFLDLGFAIASVGLNSGVGALESTFTDCNDLAVAAAPLALAAADLNGDGTLDLVSASLEDNTISVQLGRGNGTFLPRSDVDVGTSPLAVALADVNGDGRPDALTANAQDDTVSVLLGQGDGSFGNRTDLPVGDLPRWVAAADFDGDGDQDLVVANGDSDTVSVLTGNGDGTFGPPADMPVGPNPSPGVVVDVNGDGKLDLLTPTWEPSTAQSTITVLLGNGDGTFAGRREFPAGRNAFFFAVATGDLNGDGNLDLAVANYTTPGTVAVLLGDGNGGFGQPTAVDVGSEPGGVTLGDLDGDGRLDLVTANRGGSVSLLVGVGDGTFQNRTDITLFGQVDNVLAADFNHDGQLDLATARFTLDAVTVLLSGGPDSSGVASPRLGAKRFTYDAKFNQLTGQTDERGRQTRYQIDPNTGNTLAITRIIGDAGGDDDAVTHITYTTHGLVDTVTDPLGRVTDYDYDPLGRLATVIHAKGTADEGVQHFEYDTAGNQTAFTDENGNRTEFEFDVMNRLAKITESDPDGPAGPLTSPVSRFTYDEAGNLKTITDALDHVTTNEYDRQNRLVLTRDARGQETRYGYDFAGNLVSVTDPLDHETRYVLDARNRVEKIIDPEGAVTRFRYDFDDNVIALTDPVGNVTRFAFDARNRMVRETDALGHHMHYDYDAADNLVLKTDRNGRQTRFAYDDLNRLTTESWLVSGQPPANRVQYSYDLVGNLQSARDSSSALTLSYDSRNRRKTVDNAGTPGGPHVAISYVYDAAGNILSVTNTINGQPGASNSYTVDSLNRVTQITQAGAGVADKRVDFRYNPLGQFASIQRYSDLTGTQLAVASTYEYDPLNRLENLTHRNADEQVVSFFDYTYDDASRITDVIDIDGATAYTYDDSNQLTGADHADAQNPDESYTYDANGNRIESHLHGTGYETGPGNRLLSDGTFDYDYDAEGNVIRRTEIATSKVRELEWDHRNRLVAVVDKGANGNPVQTVLFTYDALDRRISKAVDTAPADAVDAFLTHFVYDRDDVLLDFIDDDGAGPHAPMLTQRYLHGPAIDQALAQEHATGADWLLADHMGTVHDLMSHAGAVVSHVSYDSFGNAVLTAIPALETRYLFTGREFDQETNLYYARLRYYDSALGRFVQQDPIGFSGGEPNTFRYAQNSPNLLSDPYGTDPDSPNGTDLPDGVYVESAQYSQWPGIPFSHTLVVVVVDGMRTTYDSYFDSGEIVRARNHYRPEPPVQGRWRELVPPPIGISPRQFAQDVVDSAESAIDRRDKYDRRGNEGLNCHSITRDIIHGAGGSVSGIDPPWLDTLDPHRYTPLLPVPLFWDYLGRDRA